DGSPAGSPDVDRSRDYDGGRRDASRETLSKADSFAVAVTATLYRNGVGQEFRHQTATAEPSAWGRGMWLLILPAAKKINWSPMGVAALNCGGSPPSARAVRHAAPDRIRPASPPRRQTAG